MASWNVLQCNKGVYCCRAATDTTNCCSNSSAVISTDIGTIMLPTATATTTVGTGTAAATVTVTAVSGAASEQTTAGSGTGNGTVESTCPADKSAVVGGAVGGALGAALLASLGALAFMVVRRRKDDNIPAYPAQVQGSSMVQHSPGFLEYYSKPAQHPDGSYVPPQELPVRARHEMQ